MLYTLAKSQACRDGNKRVALIVLRAFLHINGARLAADEDAIAENILRAAESDRQVRDDEIIALTAWLETAIDVDKENDEEKQ